MVDQRKPVPSGIHLAPSILDSDLATLAETLQLLNHEQIEIVHLDVMDGAFVPNISIGIPVIAAARRHSRTFLDVHLMIQQPERYVEQFIEAGADLVTVHWEATPHVHRAVQQIAQAGARAGVALNPATPIEVLTDLLDDVSLVLLMSVNPGFGGQAFISRTLDKIQRLRHEICARDLDVTIEVDGGINPTTAPSVLQAGADWLVAGSAIFRHDDGPEAGIAALHRALKR